MPLWNGRTPMNEVSFATMLVSVAAASFLCRVAGYVLMAWIRVTARLEAALRAVPLAVMVGLVTPAAASGRPPELLGLLAVVLAMKIARNDLVAAVAGAATVALCRWWL